MTDKIFVYEVITWKRRNAILEIKFEYSHDEIETY